MTDDAGWKKPVSSGSTTSFLLSSWLTRAIPPVVPNLEADTEADTDERGSSNQ